LDAAVLGIAEGGNEVLNPALLDGGAVREVGIARRVAGDVGPAFQDPVAPVGMPRIGGLLGAVLGNGKATQVRAVARELRRPVEQIEGEAWLSAAGLGVLDPGVHPLAVARAHRDAFKIPVAAVVGGVLSKTVGVRSIAAVAIKRQVQVGELGGGGKGSAVD